MFHGFGDTCCVYPDYFPRIKPLQKTQGIVNGTSGGAGQQQVAALSDISAQVQQYQQFLGEQHELYIFPLFFLIIIITLF